MSRFTAACLSLTVFLAGCLLAPEPGGGYRNEGYRGEGRGWGDRGEWRGRQHEWRERDYDRR